MAFLDFDCLVVSNQRFDIESLQDTFSFFTSLGIRKWIFTLNVDRNRHTVAWMVDRLKQLKEILRSVRPHGISIFVCADLQLSDGIVYDAEIGRLCLGHSDLIFTKLPLFSDADWIDADINHLLFKKKLSPIFSTFETNLRTNPTPTLDRWLHSKFTRIALDLNYITATNAEFRIRQCLQYYTPILPTLSNGLSDYAGVLQAFSDFRSRIGDADYVRFCRLVQATDHWLFSAIEDRCRLLKR